MWDPADEAAQAHQHVLRHAPSHVRGRREQHAVDERRRAGGRLAEHQDVRRDRRRGEVAGLDAAHHGHERQRQARRVRRAGPAGRSDEGQAAQRRVLRRLACAGWLGLGLAARLPGPRRAPGPGLQSVGDGTRRGLSGAVRQPRSEEPGVLAARHGHRSQRRRLGAACERPHGQLRPPQVQGAERTDGHRRALS